MVRSLGINEDEVVLPKGTRVVLRRDLTAEDGYVHRTASLATVVSVQYNTYRLETPSGRSFNAQRDQITVQKKEVLSELGVRQWDFVRLERSVIFSSVVGSQAWGLAGPGSDEDVRGVFVAPFEDSAGLWTVPPEIHDPHHERAYWEIARCMTQGLKGDANTLEMLWSPLHRTVSPLGKALVDQRRMFVSMNVLGSFGRYAQSQFKKIERTLKRHHGQRILVEAVGAGRVSDARGAVEWLRKSEGGSASEWALELKAILRSLVDRGTIGGVDFGEFAKAVADGRGQALRPAPYRPKNAYNLLRLLYSCLSWLTTQEPLIRVDGPRRDSLLAIKNLQQPIEQTLATAKAVAAEVETVAKSATLPESPDYERADAFLRRCRRAAARKSIVGVESDLDSAPAERPASIEHDPSGIHQAALVSGLPDEWTPTFLPVLLPEDVDREALEAFLRLRAQHGVETARNPLWVSLTGAHAYGFPSPDSDLDLKGVHVARADHLLGLRSPPNPDDVLDEFRGREYDYTTHEVGVFARRLVAGNGNAIEQLLGPFVVLKTEGGHLLAAWARANLATNAVGHYRGFLRSIRREYERESERGQRKAKRLLYGYRVGLTGIHLLRHGELQMDVRTFADRWPRIGELVTVKESAERQTLPADAEDRPYLEDLDLIDAELSRAAEQSSLPPRPSDIDGLSRLLVVLRPR